MASKPMTRMKLFKAREGSESLKGTIPSEVVKTMKLKHGDEIDWEVQIEGKDFIAKVRKVK